MYRTLGLIDVSRDPAITAFLSERRRVGSHSLLEWVVRRISEAQQLDQILIISNCPEHAHQLRQSAPSCAPVLCLQQQDPLARAVSVVEDYNVESLVRIRLEQPLIDPVLIDQIITSARKSTICDYATFVASQSVSLATRIGLFADWFLGSALRRANQLATQPEERRDLAGYIMHHPETFALRLVTTPSQLDRDDVRLTMNSADDWEHFDAIYDALGPDALDWHRVSGLLESHPEIRQRMAELNSHELHPAGKP